MPLTQKARAAGIGIVAAGALTAGLGVALPFMTGSFQGASREPAAHEQGEQSATPAPGGPGVTPDAATQAELDAAANEALIAGLDPLGRCLWQHGVHPEGSLGPWQNPALPYDDRSPADRAALTLRAELLRHHPGAILEVISEGDAAGAPGTGPILVIARADSGLGDAELPGLLAASAAAPGAHQTLMDLGVPVTVSATAAGAMADICALEEQLVTFAAAQPAPDPATGQAGFQWTSGLDPIGGTLLISTSPDYAAPLRESLATVGTAFLVTEDFPQP